MLGDLESVYESVPSSSHDSSPGRRRHPVRVAPGTLLWSCIGFTVAICLVLSCLQWWHGASGTSSHGWLQHRQLTLPAAPKLPADGNAFLDAADQERVKKARLKPLLSPPTEPEQDWHQRSLLMSTAAASGIKEPHQSIEGKDTQMHPAATDDSFQEHLQSSAIRQIGDAQPALVHLPYSSSTQPAAALRPEQQLVPKDLAASAIAKSGRRLHELPDAPVDYELLMSQVCCTHPPGCICFSIGRTRHGQATLACRFASVAC